jgi:cytochrome bd ubiquinol oxidase subunit I
LPWIAAELGWYVAEVGRQPWVIEGVLPTFLAVSSISAGNVLTTLIGFILFYSTLAIVDAYLMVKTVRIGPAIVSTERKLLKPPIMGKRPVVIPAE